MQPRFQKLAETLIKLIFAPESDRRLVGLCVAAKYWGEEGVKCNAAPGEQPGALLEDQEVEKSKMQLTLGEKKKYHSHPTPFSHRARHNLLTGGKTDCGRTAAGLPRCRERNFASDAIPK